MSPLTALRTAEDVRDVGGLTSGERARLAAAIEMLRLAMGLPGVQCAWCGAVLARGSPGPVSHGICRECMERMEGEVDGRD